MDISDVIRLVNASGPDKKVDMMCKLHDENKTVPTEFFSLIRKGEEQPATQKEIYNRSLKSMGFESADSFMDFIASTLK